MGGSPLSRPSTPGRSPPPENGPLPPLPEDQAKPTPAPRRSSFGFLRRSKSGDGLSRRAASGTKLTKRNQFNQEQQEALRRQQETDAALQYPPKLPDLTPPPPIQTFGDENGRPDPYAIISNKLGGSYSHLPLSSRPAVPIPPIPESSPNGGPRSGESMAHRGRYSYASSMVSTVNGPRRVRRRKDPTPFNVLVIGSQNSGKTSFLNFLRTSLALKPKRKGQLKGESPEPYPNPAGQADLRHSAFTSHYVETEIDGERIGLTLWDSQALERNIVDLQLREMTSFLESKFEETFAEEMKVVRAPGVQDTHVHCVFLVLDPIRLDANIGAAKKKLTAAAQNGANGIVAKERTPGALDQDLDLQVLRALQGKTTVIPVISKADTITTAHMSFLKQSVWNSLQNTRIDLLEALGVDDLDTFLDSTASSEVGNADDESDYGDDAGSIVVSSSPEEPNGSNGATDVPPSSSAHAAKRQPHFLPLSIISPDMYDPGVVGRKFPWGFADPYNTEHCDFVRLKDSVFSEWRADLKEASREVWYEQWRTSRLNKTRD